MVKQINIQQTLSETKEKPSFKRRMKENVLTSNWSRIADEIGYSDFEVDEISLKYIRFFCSKSDLYYPEITPFKGLFCMGAVGTGKTANFKIYKAIYHRIDLEYNGYKFKPLAWVNNDSIRIFHVKEIESNAYKIGEEFIEMLSSVSNLVIDDLGDETGDFYKTGRNVVADIINHRYSRMRDKGLVPHFTTNLTKEDLISKYGDRIFDRITEMTLRIVIPAETKSRRK